MSTPISEYAPIGDGRTVALVSRRGSIDWLCLPDLDSPACFTALLGGPEHGRWLLTVRDAHTVERRYVGESFVLETTYRTPTGTAVVTDAMPTGDGRADIVRRLEVREGVVTVEHDWVVRFAYGAIEPWVSRTDDDAVRAVAGPDSLTLRGDRLPSHPRLGHHHHHHHDVFEARAGERLDLTCTWTPSWEPVPDPLAGDARIVSTIAEWQRWAARLAVGPEHRDVVVRSLLVLRLLTHSVTGGIAAAATTSLPEDPGGERNWDYRFCWLRDAALTVIALVAAGAVDEAQTWRDWLLRAVAGRGEDVLVLYALDGSRDASLRESELAHLPGWGGSRPVRIGNAASVQVQHDVFGEVSLALDAAARAGLPQSPAAWAVQRALVNHLLDHWQEPDHGIWEVRGPTQHFVQSRIMCWAAFDAAIRAVEVHGYDMHGHEEDLPRWRTARAAVHAEVLAKGWDPELGSFVQHYGARHVDASLLTMIRAGFLPPDDPRVVATVRRVRADLSTPDGFVRRYSTDETADGLRGSEATFVVCTFWMVDALCAIGEVEDAEALFDRALSACNDVGIMSEELGEAGEQLGNVPQALSHLGLVRAAQRLAEARAARTTDPGRGGAAGTTNELGGLA